MRSIASRLGPWPLRPRAWGVFWNPPTLWRLAVLRQADGARVQGVQSLHWPEGLAHLSPEPGSWSEPVLPAQPWPRPRPPLGLALAQDLCRQGQGALGHPTAWADTCAQVQWQAAQALGLDAHAVAFDLQAHADGTLHWCACAQAHTQPWQTLAWAQRWRLHRAEPETQAAERALRHWRADPHTAWATPAQDWRFDLQHRLHDAAELPALQGTPAWSALVACGAALGAWA